MRSTAFFQRPTKFFLGLYGLLVILLFLYSFTQIDLGLTLTRASWFASLQHVFQYIGYFNRPLSTLFYSLLVILLFVFYGAYLLFAKRAVLTQKTVWLTVIFLTVVLTLSYTAFSYDIFNYIFDAKIVTQYNENPYFKKALDYPTDPMLAFMHWTHRTYPYGPTWLLVTVPLSFLGLQFFLPTYFLFKILAAAAYVGTIFAISRIMREISPKHEVTGMVFFALNPLVIIESLISGHNDIVMMCLGMFSLLFLIKRKYLFAFALLVFSIGVKYATGFLLPLYIAIYLFDKKKVPIKWEPIILTFLAAMGFAIIAAVLRTTFQPWYVLYLLPFAALLAYRYFIIIPAVFLTFGALINYLPYLFSGNWDPPIPTILLIVNLSAVGLSLLGVGYYYFMNSRRSSLV